MAAAAERTSPGPHVPVLLDAVCNAIAPIPGKVIVDGTFGAGGYTRAFLDAGAKAVIAIDRDLTALAAAEIWAAAEPRLTFREGEFGDIEEIVREAGHDCVDAVVLDIVAHGTVPCG